MYKAVVFDMDGVILDSEKIYRIYEIKAAEHFGLPTDRIDEFCKKIVWCLILFLIQIYIIMIIER